MVCTGQNVFQKGHVECNELPESGGGVGKHTSIRGRSALRKCKKSLRDTGASFSSASALEVAGHRSKNICWQREVAEFQGSAPCAACIFLIFLQAGKLLNCYLSKLITTMKKSIVWCLALLPILILIATTTKTDSPFATSNPDSPPSGRYLYVAVPGIRNYLGYGGHGLLVFDINNNHRFVKRIKTAGLRDDGRPSNVKGVAVSVPLNSIYISTIESLQRIDLTTEKIVWEKKMEGGADRMSISPDGRVMYLPSYEKSFWNVGDCETGEVIKKLEVAKRAHNTVFGASGNIVYMGDLASTFLHIADASTHTVVRKAGPFGNNIRPFTVNHSETLAFITVDSLLGFEVGDLKNGSVLKRITVEGWNMGPVRRHGNPSHGIGLTPDETEVWLADGHNMRLHVFKATPPYQQLTTIPVQDMPGWITFSLDGKYAYPSSGEVIDVKTRKVLLTLQDEFYNNVSSEKLVEIQFAGNKAIKAGDQFGIGRATAAK
jgi:DNA-binding beta-propeller fold protein YncE